MAYATVGFGMTTWAEKNFSSGAFLPILMRAVKIEHKEIGPGKISRILKGRETWQQK